MKSARKSVLLTALALAAGLTTINAGTGGLFFDGVNDYVTFGQATNINNLGVTNFTIECWFKRQGAGKRGNTGSGGFFALPLVTKGMAENEAGRTNMNYYFGIGTNGSGQTVLVADFEDFNTGLNHPVYGTNIVGSNVWVHAAVTYDIATTNWALYVNGQPDATTNIFGVNGSAITNATMLFPRYDSVQHAALASCLRANGNTNSPDSGFFAGSMDEVRIWNYARSAGDIAANYTVPITNETGLIARWGLDEPSGISLANSIAGGVAGRFTNGPSISAATWTNGYFIAPSVSITNPQNNGTISGTTITIEVTASDPEGTVAKVEFYNGNTLLGDDTTEPYSFAWTGVAPGVYPLTAVATDNLGLMGTSAVVNVSVTPPPGVGGLYFDGRNDYVTMGAASGVGVSNFTVECWFKQQGAGKRSNTGTGGINAIPLVTKGMAEAENSSVDCNWFFGIGTNNFGEAVLAADFEDFNNGLNHPFRGSALVSSNVWQHAAVTYDVASSNWVLYLNGVQDASTNILGFNGSAITNVLQLFPRYDSTQHGALGTSLLSSGNTNASSGFFAGTMDEVRVWDYARSAQDIADNYQAQIPSASGLIARWALDDTTGLAATNSGTSGVTGTLTNGPVWVDGYTFASAPTITDQPDSTNVNCGDNASFSVTATGALNYQWYFANTLLSGETNSSLSLNAVTGANTGSYLVTVQNGGGSVTSSPVGLTITDTTPPIISVCATGAALSANASCQAAIPDLTGQVPASDSCSAVTISQSPVAGTLVGLGNHTVTITVTDAATNTATCDATVTVNDTTAPMISVCATNMTLSADTNCQATIPDLTIQIAASDACSAVTLTQTPLAGTVVGPGNHLVTITATDAANNSANCSATVTVNDTTAPVITLCATNMTLNADTNCQATIPDLTAQVLASDACSAVTVTQLPLAGTTVGAGNHLVTLTVTDAANNQTTCAATITVVDVTAPIIAVCATNLTLNADTNCQAAIPDLTAQVVASDSCGAVTITQSPVAGTLVGLGSHLVTLTVADATSNTANCPATVTVVDVTAPVLTACATNITLSADTNCQAVIPDMTIQIVASDSCDAATISQSPLAGTLVGPGNHVVTLTATDAASNMVTCLATVTVNDMTAPVVSVCATNMTLSADTNCQATIPDLTMQVIASDTCGAVTVSQSPIAGTLVGPGNHNVTLTATDAANNTTTCVATVTVNDTTVPIITACATNITLFADTNCQAAIPDMTIQIVASDSCGAMTITQSPLAGTLVSLGNHTITITVADAANNTSTCMATANVIDITPPNLTVCATNVIVNADTNCQAAIPDLTSQIMASDSCGAVTIQQLPAAGTLVGLGNHMVFITVADAANNQAACSAAVTVADTTAPIIAVCATNLTLNADTNCQAAIPDLTSQVVASDSCGALTITQSPVAGALVGLGDTLVTLTVMDTANNQTICTATVTVVDASAPIITAQPQNSTNLIGSIATFSVTANSCSVVSYQWLFGTNMLAGETNATLMLPNVQPGHAGSYRAMLANGAGNSHCAAAMLMVQIPIAPTVAAGPMILGNGHFYVGFTGTPNVPYTIECAPAVIGPWQVLTNLTADSLGFIPVEDFTTPAPPKRFYRAVYP